MSILSPLSQENYQLWSNDPFFSKEVHQELRSIAENPEEIEERFYKNLEVGTGGLRGIIGAGTNRINIYTVSQITEGIARMIAAEGEIAKNKGVCISYDSRNMSPEFALQTALVLAYHGIKSYLFKNLHPTPLLSFAVSYLQASAGVMITASHNPAKYNGYKMYGPDGGQMPPESADLVIKYMNELKDIRDLKWLTEQEAIEKGLLNYIGSEIDEAYEKVLFDMCIDHEALKRASEVKLVYTPLHGSGYLPVMNIFQKLGYSQAEVVKEQALPDGNFPTVSYPNPEERSALLLAISRAKEIGAELVLATDPDADRMGVALRNQAGEYEVLTGNQIGILLLDYILNAKAKNNSLSRESFVATTIVSSRLVKEIARAYQVEFFEVLTGFKYIGELIKQYNDTGKLSFQFGFEESFGYLATDKVRDKDAVSACMLFAEMLISTKLNNETIFNRLEKIYQKYGYGLEKTVSITLEGQEGIKKIKNALDKLRNNINLIPSDFSLVSCSDFLKRVKTNYNQARDLSKEEKILLPESNVLLYELSGLDWICVRPSGTEPKLKIYAGAYSDNRTDCQLKLDKLSTNFEKLIRSLLD